MKTLLAFALSLSCLSAFALVPNDPIWGKDYYKSLPTHVMGKARDLHKGCKSYRLQSLVKKCLVTEVKNVRLSQVDAHNRTGFRSSCMVGEERRILNRINYFYLSGLPNAKLETGTEAQLVEQLINEISYLDAIELSASTGEPMLCG